MARLLVSSCNLARGGIYYVNTGTGKARRVFRRSCRGMALGPDGIYTVLEERGIIYRLEPWTWEATRVTNTHLHGAHDLRWIDGSFYVVGCKGNVVARFDPGFEPLDRFTVVDSPEDVCHANCLTTSGESLLPSVSSPSPRVPARRRTRRRNGGAAASFCGWTGTAAATRSPSSPWRSPTASSGARSASTSASPTPRRSAR
jgi:hypothetical protein